MAPVCRAVTDSCSCIMLGRRYNSYSYGRGQSRHRLRTSECGCQMLGGAHWHEAPMPPEHKAESHRAARQPLQVGERCQPSHHACHCRCHWRKYRPAQDSNQRMPRPLALPGRLQLPLWLTGNALQYRLLQIKNYTEPQLPDACISSNFQRFAGCLAEDRR